MLIGNEQEMMSADYYGYFEYINWRTSFFTIHLEGQSTTLVFELINLSVNLYELEKMTLLN